MMDEEYSWNDRQSQKYIYKKCPVCGKKFCLSCPLDDWAYQMRSGGSVSHPTHFCSWTCLREFEKEKEKKQRLKRNNWHIK